MASCGRRRRARAARRAQSLRNNAAYDARTQHPRLAAMRSASLIATSDAVGAPMRLITVTDLQVGGVLKLGNTELVLSTDTPL